MKPDDQLSLGFENSGTKSATLKVDTVRRWAMNRQYPLCYQEENVKNAKCSLSEMNLLLKQMQLSWLSKHNQVRGCQNDAWNIQKHLSDVYSSLDYKNLVSSCSDVVYFHYYRTNWRRRCWDRLSHNMRRLQSCVTSEEICVPRNQCKMCEGRYS